MRAWLPKTFVAVSVVVAALATGACRRSSDHEEAKATAEAELKAAEGTSQTTITSSEIGASDGPKSEPTEEREVREDNLIATRNEQLEYRAKLQKALDDLDGKRRDARKRGRGRDQVKAIDARREILKHDLVAVERTTDTEWGSLKAKIDRDLKEHAGDRGSKGSE